MLYHHIMKSDEGRVRRQLVVEQEEHPIKACWIENLKEEATYHQIEVEKGKVVTKSKKRAWKKETKKIVENIGKEERTTKMRS